MTIKATDLNFQEEVLNSEVPVLVDFWATWCKPCQMLAPIVEEISDKFDGQVKVVKVDVDESPDISKKIGILSVPTLVLFKDGKPLGKIAGFKPAEQIESAIRSTLAI